jgi:hypothetical protein
VLCSRVQAGSLYYIIPRVQAGSLYYIIPRVQGGSLYYIIPKENWVRDHNLPRVEM